MQYKKESSTKLLKKCAFRKPSMYNKKQEKQHSIITQSRIKSQISEKSIIRPSSGCKHCGSSDTGELLRRFKDLEKKYFCTLENIKQKNIVYELQNKELNKLRVEHQKGKNQIHRLRTMLGFMKRQDTGTQVNFQEISVGSWANKVQKSTDQELFRQQKRRAETPKKARSPNRQLQSFAFYSKNLSNQSAKTLPQRPRIQKKKQTKQLKQTEQSHINKSSMRKSRKFLEESYINNPQSIKSQHKMSNSPYSKLRYIARDICIS